MTDSKNRGVKDTFFLVCDAPKGLPEVVGNVWPLTSVQTCVIPLISNTVKLASKMARLSSPRRWIGTPSNGM